MATRCFDELKKSLGDRFDEKSANAILRDLDLLDGLVKNSEGAASFRKKALDYFKDNQILYPSQVKYKHDNLFKLKEVNAKTTKLIENGLEPKKALEAVIARTGYQGFDSGFNVESLSSANRSELSSMLMQMGDDRLSLMKSNKISKEIAMELEQFHLNKGGAGISKSTDAYEIAKHIYATQNRFKQMMKDAGVEVPTLYGRFVKNTHDSGKIRDLGGTHEQQFEQWLEEIYPKLDIEKTFGIEAGTPKARLEMLRESFDSIMFGKNEVADGFDMADELVTVNKRTQGLDKSVGKKRSLHFKDAESWSAYNDKFGKQSFSDTILSEIDTFARNAALIKVLGTNPKATFEGHISRMQSYLKRNNRFDDLKKFNASLDGHSGLRNLYKHVTGEANHGVDNIGAKIGSAVRAHQVIMKLGMSTLGSMPDIGTSAGLISAKTGKNFIKSHWDTVSAALGASKEQRKLYSGDLAIFTDDITGEIFQRVGFDGEGHGMASKAVTKYLKMVGLHGWTQRIKFATVSMYSRELARNAGKSFDQISPRLKESMNRYGITGKHWDLMRTNVENFGPGRDQIHLGSIKRAGGDADLLSRVGNLFTDLANIGAPTPGARQKTMILGSTGRGEFWGEMIRFTSQFKSFGLTMPETLFHIANADPTRPINGISQFYKGDRKALFGMAASLTALGYISESARAVFKGDMPPDPTDPEVWVKAMVRGGSMGLMGDFLFSESKKYGKSVLDDLAGPALGEFKNIYELTGDTISEVSGKPSKKNLGTKWAKAVERNVNPNVPLIKPAIHALFNEAIYETLNPGYEKKIEQRRKKNGERSLWEGF